VSALDSDPLLLGALSARARERGLAVRTHAADARSFTIEGRFALAIAPMQVFQLFGGRGARLSALQRLRAHLRGEGLAAVALADPFAGIPDDGVLAPLPDVREEAGWVYTSAPVAVRVKPAVSGGPERRATIERVRQIVSPAGELHESASAISLDLFEPAELERDAASAGLRALERHQVEETSAYVGSTVVLLEAV